MKRILILLAACGGGGGGNTGDDVDAGTDAPAVVHKATLTANWAIKNADGTPGTCFSGYPSMKLTAIYWTTEYNAPEGPDAATTKLFDCAAGSGTIELPIDAVDGYGYHQNGKWDITLEQTDMTGGTVVATDLQSQLDEPVTVDLNSGAGSMSTTFYQDGGYVWLAWLLYGPTAGDYLHTCAAAGVDKIEFTLTEHFSGVVKHLSFPCDRPDGLASGADGVEIESPTAVGAGIAPFPAGQWDFTATAYTGTTAVGTSDEGEDVIVGTKNDISILATSADITLTNGK